MNNGSRTVRLSFSEATKRWIWEGRTSLSPLSKKKSNGRTFCLIKFYKKKESFFLRRGQMPFTKLTTPQIKIDKTTNFQTFPRR